MIYVGVRCYATAVGHSVALLAGTHLMYMREPPPSRRGPDVLFTYTGQV